MNGRLEKITMTLNEWYKIYRYLMNGTYKKWKKKQSWWKANNTYKYLIDILKV